MKTKLIISLLALFVLFSCKVFLINTALEKLGIYDDKIELAYFNNDTKKILIFPMSHVGTNEFYNDVKNKIDSLKNEKYFFYYEKVTALENQDSTLRKIRKIRGVPFTQNGKMENLFDSLLSKKQKNRLKKELVNQPSYEGLGLNEKNSRNVDATLKGILNHYEIKFGSITLQECDFNNSIYEKTNCDDKFSYKEEYDEAVINYRNQIVVNEILNENQFNKIAIIYGKGHLDGISDLLLENGYKQK